MYKAIKIGKLKTSSLEIKDLSKAWIAISLAFALALSDFNLFNLGSSSFFVFLLMFPISLITAGIGFLCHELAHKFTAQHYGCVSEFRAVNQMLYLAVGLAALTGFIFAAPGAVMISGMITRKENGIISLSGPLTNYIFAGLFLVVEIVLLNPVNTIINTGLFSEFLSYVVLIGFQINAWLGLFNMLPFGNFDGKKILNWNRYVWLGMLVLGIVLVFMRSNILRFFA